MNEFSTLISIIQRIKKQIIRKKREPRDELCGFEKQNYFGYWRCWFIGSNLVKRLYKDVEDVTIIRIDNMNDYYDVRLKEDRLSELLAHPSFIFINRDLQMGGEYFDKT